LGGNASASRPVPILSTRCRQHLYRRV